LPSWGEKLRFDKVLPVTADASGLYYSATADSRTGRAYLKIVNPAAQDVPAQLTFAGRNAKLAGIEVLANPDLQAGDTLANPAAVVPARTTLQGSAGVFTYQAPANSLTVVTVSR
jgi:alpha-L-arabinofuranosidase